ncbi:MAG: C39 family peptidase [Clostridiales Family XIII bacterium]|jgi:uncharacterized protein YvpB|nr:C39 family peptidase [Clostridiales Family XIII bacterium]
MFVLLKNQFKKLNKKFCFIIVILLVIFYIISGSYEDTNLLVNYKKQMENLISGDFTPKEENKESTEIKSKSNTLNKNTEAYAQKKRTRLNVPLRVQLPKYPMGCEAAATASLLSYGTGKKITVDRIIKEMPYASNPYNGYVGNPRDKNSGWTIYPSAMKKVVKKYMGGGVDLTGKNIKIIKKYILKDKPVVVWVGHAHSTLHCICITGYSEKYIYYNNPYGTKNAKKTTKKFLKWWNQSGRKAMSY